MRVLTVAILMVVVVCAGCAGHAVTRGNGDATGGSATTGDINFPDISLWKK